MRTSIQALIAVKIMVCASITAGAVSQVSASAALDRGDESREAYSQMAAGSEPGVLTSEELKDQLEADTGMQVELLEGDSLEKSTIEESVERIDAGTSIVTELFYADDWDPEFLSFAELFLVPEGAVLKATNSQATVTSASGEFIGAVKIFDVSNDNGLISDPYGGVEEAGFEVRDGVLRYGVPAKGKIPWVTPISTRMIVMDKLHTKVWTTEGENGATNVHAPYSWAARHFLSSKDLMRMGYKELRKKVGKVMDPATMKQQYDCHVIGIWLVDKVDLEGHRESNPNWRSEVLAAMAEAWWEGGEGFTPVYAACNW